MAIFKWITVGVLICMSFIPLTHEEIHRAKVNSVKYPAKTADYVADFNQPKPDIVGLDKTREELSTVNMLESRYETWCFSIFGAILVGLSGIFPLLVIPMEAGPSLKHGAAASRLKLLLSFAVGGLLGDVFLHLLPEAWAHMDHDNGHDAHTKLGLWVIAGLLSFLIIEKMFAKEDEFERLEDECTEAEVEQYHELEHDHDTVKKNNNTDCVAHRTRHWTNKNINDKEHISNVCKNIKNGRTNAVHSVSETHIHKVEEKAKESSIKVSGYLNLAANVIDNFTHGLAVAGGFLISNKVGFITTLAILLHEIPHEVGDFAILLRSGFDRWKAAKAQLLTATGGMVGALTALTADSAQAAGDRTAWILPFTSGGFLYIALVTVVPDLLKEKHPKESTKQVTCLLAGILAMYLVSLVH